MKEYSKPRLSASRDGTIPNDTLQMTKADLRYGRKKGYVVGKAVTAWFNDIKYVEEEVYTQEKSNEKVISYHVNPLSNPYGYEIENYRMLSVSKRIEMATNLNVSSRHGASQYQTTNYGLGGMVTQHSDPYGYESGIDLVESQKTLSRSGDIIATFMGWFEDTTLGGPTAFTKSNFEGILSPTRGSAAFWTNMLSCHKTDTRSNHAGCPVLMGSKWILNKWLFSWDQWKVWPCYLKKHTTILPFRGLSSNYH